MSVSVVAGPRNQIKRATVSDVALFLCTRQEERVDDAALVAAFESTELEQFSHVEHVRVAWWYLRTLPLADAIARCSTGIQRFAAANRDLFSRSVLSRHSSEELLDSEGARRAFVMPDKDPLPHAAPQA